MPWTSTLHVASIAELVIHILRSLPIHWRCRGSPNTPLRDAIFIIIVFAGCECQGSPRQRPRRTTGRRTTTEERQETSDREGCDRAEKERDSSVSRPFFARQLTFEPADKDKALVQSRRKEKTKTTPQKGSLSRFGHVLKWAGLKAARGGRGTAVGRVLTVGWVEPAQVGYNRRPQEPARNKHPK
jgi:hypothetical protein